ncbi:multicopper oxidase family protein [Gordonia neofelifaecis]|uniref:Copper-binding oxidase n=1 Tax=Gordonia neofelifaecis NRRL B-59395 TaxID=644548 RepID=F1YLH4_9ACTN|nr:multicopper oxidase family protein [Gordonia neofelifaecis]EGD54368.1 copper-binding oxidase [Gordonia neofelifaecis NRRL B-59395]
MTAKPGAPSPTTPKAVDSVTRRSFLTAVALTGAATVAACTRTAEPAGPPAATSDRGVVAAAERARPHTGRTVEATLRAAESEIDLGGGVRARTLAYNGSVPGPLLRADVGDELSVNVENRLPKATSMHWHGIALRNDMDGAAPATPDIASGDDFTYRFSLPHPGTYWAHPHVGMDTDYGLYLPLIVDDPADPGRYDAEWTVVLDDWTSGVGKSPEQILEGLRPAGSTGGHGSMDHSGMDMGGMDMSTGDMAGMGMNSSDLLGGDAGDVTYPHYLINGRVETDPSVMRARPGERVRLRIINAAADTAFRVALGGHTMTLTHTDGFPIVPTPTAAVLVGMGERYDAIVTVGDGAFPLIAQPEGKSGRARAVLTTAPNTDVTTAQAAAELSGPVTTAYGLRALDSVALPAQRPDVELTARLTGSMMAYDWAINGQRYPDVTPMRVTQGQAVRLTFVNESSMWHPVHLHGHTFALRRADGVPGARKDTVNVLPRSSVSVDLVADNPGAWMLHCHNGYHMDSGMMTRLDVG